MVQVGDYNVKVADARKMLTNFNRHLREDVYSGVWLMNTAQLQNAMKDFKYDKKNGKVKHKTKAKMWEYMVGSVGKKMEKPKKPKAEKKPKKSKPEPVKEEVEEEVMEEEEVKEEKPKPAEKKKRKPSAYAVFMGQQRKKGKSMKEIAEMWKKQSKK